MIRVWRMNDVKRKIGQWRLVVGIEDIYFISLKHNKKSFLYILWTNRADSSRYDPQHPIAKATALYKENNLGLTLSQFLKLTFSAKPMARLLKIYAKHCDKQYEERQKENYQITY